MTALRRTGLVVAAIGLLAAGCESGGGAGAGDTGPVSVTVPNVVGMTEAGARAAIAAAGLGVGAVSQAASPTVPAGSVASQDPAAGVTVVASSAVAIVVSTGPDPVSITTPDVVGMTQASAQTAIIAAGLVVGTVTQASSPTVPSGIVVSQDPVGGTSALVGDAVNLVISTGPAPVAVATPHVVGMTEASARVAISDAGLVVGSVIQAASSAVPTGSVVSQDPAAGTQVQPGALVNLVVSSGPPPGEPVAPPLDPNGSTTFVDAVSFLYTGPGAVQTGVAPGAIQPAQVSVLRGKVLDRAGAPVPGVRVTALGHPELGETRSQVDGQFSLAVNGGDQVQVRFDATGYLPVVRAASPRWRQYARLPDVVIIPHDPVATVVDLTQPGVKVARGSVVTDAAGTRQATLLFPPGTTATLVGAGGGTAPASVLTIRATEYTVGAGGPAAMPGELPPTSAYTYAAEFGADEAVAVGAERVEFSQPVITYVEDFIGFPVGSAVPVGSFDRRLGVWVGEANGRVVEVVSVSPSGLADLDVDGTGGASSPVALTALGVTDAERARLGGLYGAGTRLWRVPVTHFTPWDCNWPWAPGTSSMPPDQKLPRKPDPLGPERDCNQAGSIIGCERRVLGQRVPMVGTPYALHYSSDRSVGYLSRFKLDVPLTGDTIPADLAVVELTTEYLGQSQTASFSPAPNLKTTVWLGRNDPFGRPVAGSIPYRIVLTYAYRLVYTPIPSEISNAWARVMAYDLQPFFPRRDPSMLLRMNQETIGAVPGLPPLSDGLGSWSVDVHHALDIEGGILYLGDGSKRIVDASPNQGTVRKFASTGGYQIAAANDGAVFALRLGLNDVLRIAPDGIGTPFAGTVASGFSGDGGPATAAQLNGPQGLAVGSDGSLFIADTGNCRVRKVDPRGIITTVAGNGTCPTGVPIDGQDALQAGIAYPEAVAEGPDGTLYVGSFTTVYRVGTDGLLFRFAGTGNTVGPLGDGGPALDASFYQIVGLAVGPDGSVIIADHAHLRIRRVGQDGIVRTIVGSFNNSVQPEVQVPALQAVVSPWQLQATRDGRVFFVDSRFDGVRVLTPDGMVNWVAGRQSTLPLTDFTRQPVYSAFEAAIEGPLGIAVSPDGAIYVSRADDILRLAPAFPAYSDTDKVVASTDGREMYEFDDKGRHLRTRDALTGAVRLSFGYDGGGLLASVTDESGRITTIVRTTQGVATAIQGPFGQTTSLDVNGDGFLRTITDPAGGSVTLAYAADGLMTSLTDPRGNLHRFSYDGEGRLVRDEDPTGAASTLATTVETDARKTVSFTSAAGRTTTYTSELRPNGERVRAFVSPSGLSTTSVEVGARTQVSMPDGTTARTDVGADPRWGMQAPLVTSGEVCVPGIACLNMSRTRTVQLSDPSNKLSLVTQTDVLNVNGLVTTSSYDATSGTRTITSPAGRTSYLRMDAQGRPVERADRGQVPRQLTYDSRGLVVAMTQGARTWSFAYDSLGRLATSTDPLGLTTAFAWDAAGRLTSATGADGGVTGLGHDASGNLTSVSPPGGAVHGLGYSTLDLVASYGPPTLPGAGPTTYGYDADRQLAAVGLPDGGSLSLGRDAAGRITSLTGPNGQTTYAYSPTTGRIASIAAPGGAGLDFTWAGELLTRVAHTGPVAGTVQRTYNNNFWVSSEQVNGGNAVSFTRDRDGLLTSAGPLSLTRAPDSGRVTATLLGVIQTTDSYNTYEEPLASAASASGSTVYSVSYTLDGMGRIGAIDETILGASRRVDYRYDSMGRLDQVTVNGSVAASYGYDLNGNRTSVGTGGASIPATFDAQDRLETQGSASYSFGLGGDLTSRSAAGQVSGYTYDPTGNLLGATLPDGTRIDYLVDGRNRRIGKSANGVRTQGFLYFESLRPAAELNGSGAVVSRFVYASRTGAPAYVVRGGVTYRVVSDHLGSPRLVIDSGTGAVVQRLDYDAFGRVTLDTNPGFQPFGFAGGLYDRDTGLVRLGLRDYDAETGRWTAKDPIGFSGGQANLYSYVSNDPVNRLDPTGTAVSWGFAGDFAGLGEGGGAVSIASSLVAGSAAATGALLVATLGILVWDAYLLTTVDWDYGLGFSLDDLSRKMRFCP